MNEPQTNYWDACIASLPPVKRAAAEQAYQEIAGDGGDGQSSKLFLLLEAHAVHNNKILERMTEAGEQVAARMGDAGASGATDPVMNQKGLENLLTAVQAVDVRQPVKELKEKTGVAVMELKRLNTQISHLRNFRVGMAVFLMILTVIATLAVVWLLNRETIHTVMELKRNGLAMNTYEETGHLRIFIEGTGGKAAMINNEGQIQGVAAEFPLK